MGLRPRVERDLPRLGLGRPASAAVAIAGVMGGAEVNELVHPDDRPAVRKELVAGLKGEKTICQVDCRVRIEGGGWRWVRATGRVTERNALGRAARTSGTVGDIEDHKRAETALAEREQRFRDMAQASGEYLWEGGRVVALYLPLGAGRGGPRLPSRGAARAQGAGVSCRSARTARWRSWFANQAPDGDAFRELVHRVGHPLARRDLAIGERGAGARPHGRLRRLPRHGGRHHAAPPGRGARSSTSRRATR